MIGVVVSFVLYKLFLYLYVMNPVVLFMVLDRQSKKSKSPSCRKKMVTIHVSWILYRTPFLCRLSDYWAINPVISQFDVLMINHSGDWKRVPLHVDTRRVGIAISRRSGHSEDWSGVRFYIILFPFSSFLLPNVIVLFAEERGLYSVFVFLLMWTLRTTYGRKKQQS